MKVGHKVIIGIAALATLGLGSAQAHPFGMGFPDACAHGYDMKGKHARPGKQANVDRAAMATARLDKLKAELKITADQETAWQAFAGKAKQQAEHMQALRDKMQPPASTAKPLSAPEHMDKAIEFMKQRLAGMEAMSQSAKELYAVLTPEQKAVADQHFMQPIKQKSRDKMRQRMNPPPAAGAAEAK